MLITGPSPRLILGDFGRQFEDPPRDWTVSQFSPDGKYILARCIEAKRNDVVKLWDARTGKEIRVYRSPKLAKDQIWTVSFSPDGKLVFAAGTGNLVAWDRELGTELFSSTGASAIAPTSDGAKVLIGGVAYIGVLDAKDGKIIKEVRRGPEFLNNLPHKIHVSPNGKWFVFDTGTEIAIWDFEKMEMIILGTSNSWPRVPKNQYRLPEKHSPLGFAISPGGQGILIPTPGGVLVEVDYATGKEKKRYQLEGEGINTGVFCISPKGDMVMACNINNGDTRVYSFPECKELQRIRGYGYVQFSPDGNTALTFTKDGRMMLWDLK